jgi:hypothetical protein
MFVKKSDKYISVEEAADRLGKSVGQINLYIWLHLIPNVEQVGKHYIIPVEEVFKIEEKSRFDSSVYLSEKQNTALYS